MPELETTVRTTPEHGPRALEAAAALRQELTCVNVEFLNCADFDRAQRITRLLQEICAVEERIRAVLAGEAPPSSDGGRAGVAESESEGGLDPDAYPRYVRRGSSIVKIGLTRDKTDTYEQRLDRNDYEPIRDALLPYAEGGQTFEAGDIIGAVNVPSYLVYLLLGLLQEYNLLDSPSRGDYRFGSQAGVSEIDAVWTAVPAAGSS